MPLLLLLLACVTNVGAAVSASRVPAAACDLMLHGQMAGSALRALTEQGWTAFQDPWMPDLSGGFAMFHVYPHLSHQATALVALASGLDIWGALSAGSFLVVFALPLLAYWGGRLLGLGPWGAALAALVVATMRSADSWGHAPIEYGFVDGRGMYAQLWGMAMATVALPAWIAASAPDGAGMARIPRWTRLLVAALLMSLLLRSHIPSAWIVLLTGPVIVALWGPLRELAGRLARLGLVGAGAVVLSLGFLAPFMRDLDAVSDAVLEPRSVTASVGALAVLKGLFCGDVLDGGVPGPWTLALLATVALTLWQVARRVDVDRRLVALGAAIVASLLLLFGRETWGDWVDSVPMFGRFMDKRYLLGVQLLAPWFVGLGCWQLALLGYRRTPRYAAAVAAALLLSAVTLQVRAIGADFRIAGEHRPLLHGFEQALAPIISEAAARPFEPVALGSPSPEPAGVDALELLQYRGVPVSGTPSHHFAYVGEFTKYWSAWVAGSADLRDRPVQDADLRAAAASRLLSLDAGGAPLGGDRGIPVWTVRDVAPSPEHVGDTMLVRSDLLYSSTTRTLDGFSIAWFYSGAHMVRQHPTIEVGRYAAEYDDEYSRVARSADRDPTLLDGLPGAADGTLGTIHEVGRGEGPFDRRIEVTSADPSAWLLAGIAWHPGWRAVVDGQDWPVRMLCPGFLGVHLPEGRSEVVFQWTVPAWRGTWAAANTILCLGIAGLGLVAVLRGWRTRRAET